MVQVNAKTEINYMLELIIKNSTLFQSNVSEEDLLHGQ
jgi:hypothetical protein